MGKWSSANLPGLVRQVCNAMLLAWSFRRVRLLRVSYDYATLKDDFNIKLKYTAVTDVRGTLYAFLTWSRRSLV